LLALKRVAILIAAAAFVFAAPAHAFTKQTGTRTMDDGVPIAYDLYEPDGAAPAGGWPGVIVLHGLGGSKDSMAAIAGYLASNGYAALAYTTRGHGTSGGNVELAGPREVADERAIFDWFRGLPEVGDSVGAWGISYGGGETWNGLAAGIPYAAAEVVETWTDLYAALWPDNVAKSGIVLGFAKTVDARSPLLSANENDAVHSTNMAAIRALLAPRSALPEVPSIRTPVYMFQGRVDYAFDVTQATQAYTRLAGPKHLYVGLFGHTPSTFPGPDVDYVLSQGLAWYDHYLKGLPNGIDKTPPVAIGDSPTKRRTFAGLPRTTTLVLRRGSRLTRGVTTFGGGSVTLTVRKITTYPRLVAVVSASGKPITHGGAVPHAGTLTIPLANYVQTIPRGARVTLSLGPDSGSADIAYLGFGDSGSISLGPPTIRLKVLG
jgi:predicted acyl esterase